jgi:hypothetical protein
VPAACNHITKKVDEERISSSDTQVGFMDAPTTNERMRDEITRFVDQRRETIGRLLNNAGNVSSLIPSWVPEQNIAFGDEDCG